MNNNLLKGVRGIGLRVEGILIGCVFDIQGISCVSGLMGVVWDFSLINLYGVRVKGFPCGMSGLRVDWASGLGLRVFWSSGLGLRVRSPDGHVMLLIPLYLNGVFSLFLFPHPLFPPHHWLVSHPPPFTTENVCSPFCSICWWHDGWPPPPQCSPPTGRFLSWWLIWQVILIEPLLEFYLRLHWARSFSAWWEGQCQQSGDWQSPTPSY